MCLDNPVFHVVVNSGDVIMGIQWLHRSRVPFIETLEKACDACKDQLYCN
jgi:hypothetical protein